MDCDMRDEVDSLVREMFGPSSEMARVPTLPLASASSDQTAAILPVTASSAIANQVNASVSDPKNIGTGSLELGITHHQCCTARSLK